MSCSISKTLWASIILLVCLLTNQVSADKTCMQYQRCKRPEGQDPETTPCPLSTETYNPTLINWNNQTEFGEPAVLGADSIPKMDKICPFMDTTKPLCCINDQVDIMTSSFQQIDSVFGQDVPLCGLNLKKLWCDYTCSAVQNSFVFGLGYQEVQLDVMTNMTKINFHVNEDMACSLFTSCKEVGLIAQASITSSIAFLDFMGVNGQNQSLSIITFQQHASGEQSVKMSKEDFVSKCQKRQDQTKHYEDRLLESFGVTRSDNSKFEEQAREKEQNKLKLGDDPLPMKVTPLNEKMHDCGEPIPWPIPTVDGYTSVKNTTCTFCQEMCKAPTINTTIYFFAGMDGNTVGITYGVLLGLTLIYQLFNCFYRRPKINAEYEELQNDVQNNTGLYNDINKTASTREVNQFKN